MFRKLVIAVALFFAASNVSFADTILRSFTLSGTGISASGQLTLTSTADASTYQITGITGTYTSTDFSGQITSLNNSISALTGFAHDNLFYSSSKTTTCNGATTNAALDACGLDFIVASTYEVNVYATATSAFRMQSANLVGYVLTHNTPVTFTTAATSSSTPGVAVTPEPSGLVLLGTGFVGVGFLMRRRMLHAASQAVL